MTDPRHEGLHLDEATDGTNWMENFYFGGRDEARGAAFGVHVKLRAELGRAEVRCFVDIDGSDAGFGGRYPIAQTLRYPIIDFSCIEPFRRWHLKLDTKGWPLADTRGLVGLELEGREPSVPMGFDLEVTSALPPADWADLQGIKSTDSAGHGHYDGSIAFVGNIRLGDRVVEAKGLGMRDHSWGPRNFAGLKGVWFIGATFEDERAYFAGVRSWNEDNEVVGFSYLIDKNGMTVMPCPEVEVLEGTSEPCNYHRVAVSSGDISVMVNVKKHMPMPLLPEKYLSGGTSCTLDTGSGYAMLERGRLYLDDEIEQIYRTTGAVS